MIAARYRWVWPEADERLAKEWSERLGIPLMAARVLAARGLSEAEADAFFQPADERRLENPLLLKGMPEAVERIRQALARGERIRVYGDYDADGVTSTALMIRLFTRLGATFDTYIPHRSLEGYGMNLPAIDRAAEAGVTLIVTVDNGISAVEQIAYAKEKGIDVVVTDHHEPPAVLPEACAIVNPKQPGCSYPFKGLCGAGVAFKLAHALLERPVPEWADLAAIGTVADLMPLTGENRTIVRMGLEQLRRQPTAGLRALAAVSGAEPERLTSGKIGFGLAPRLNAGGRLERADGAVRLLTTDSEEEAAQLARELDRLNGERQRLVEETAAEAETMWQERKTSFGGDGPNVIVLAGKGWNAGIAGLVASKLAERHYRPAFVLAQDAETGMCKGSARSIEGFDVHAALTACAPMLEHYGGHRAAAGLTIQAGRVMELEAALHRLAGEWLQPEDWQPRKRADLAVGLEEADMAAAEAMARLEPFGSENPTPRLVLRNVRIQECRKLGKEGKHLRLTVEQAGRTLEAVAFGAGEMAGRLGEGRTVHLLGELSVNEWNGTKRAQFVVQDLSSDEALWQDRRSEPDAWRPLALLADQTADRLDVLCASPRLAEEALGRIGLSGARVFGYEGAEDFGLSSSQTAAAMETAKEEREERVLALLGLPDNEQDQLKLQGWLKATTVWDRIVLFAAPRRKAEAAATLERRQFTQVYAMFRAQGSWIDGPEGFLRRAADQTGLPLASVRLIQDVFTELGFIRASGAERTMVAQPPRRNLEESERYRSMQRQAEAAAFPDWPLERLKSWASSRGEGASFVSLVRAAEKSV